MAKPQLFGVSLPLDTRKANGTATPTAPIIRIIEKIAAQCFEISHSISISEKLQREFLSQHPHVGKKRFFFIKIDHNELSSLVILELLELVELKL